MYSFSRPYFSIVSLIWFYFIITIIFFYIINSGAGAQSVIVKPTGCGFNPYSRRRNIYLNLYFHLFALVSRQCAALSSATQHAMPPESGRKWGTECLSTGFLCLSCCVRDTAWSWFILLIIDNFPYISLFIIIKL